MSTDLELKKKIKIIIAKSRESILIANQLYQQAHYNDAASKAYYGVFHSLQAALLILGLSFSKHSGVIAAFNKEFILGGFFPKDFSQKITRLYRDRLIGDYEYEENVSREDCEQDVIAAKEITDVIQGYLKREGFLDT